MEKGMEESVFTFSWNWHFESRGLDLSDSSEPDDFEYV